MSRAELLLISAVLRSKDHLTPQSRGITTELFHAYPQEWAWVTDYISRNGRAPSRTAFKHAFPEATLYKVDDVGHYCDEVLRSHAKHEVLRMTDEALEEVSAGDPYSALDVLQHESVRLSVAVGAAGKNTDIIDDWEGIYEEAKRRVARAENGNHAGISTGFSTLDARSGGFQPGQFVTFGARLGHGKSFSLTKMACVALAEGHTVQYNSLEMSRAQVGLRVHTFLSSSHGRKVFRNLDLVKGENYSLLDYKDFLDDLKSKLSGKLYVNDTSRGRVNLGTISAQLETVQPDICFIDYITLMEGTTDWQDVAEVSGGLKVLAERYEVPIVVAAQLNRERGLAKEPAGPEALSRGDSIGMDSDMVVTLRQMSPSVVKMKLAKYRHGPDGYIWWTKFLPNSGTFEECDYDEAMEAMEADREEADELLG